MDTLRTRQLVRWTDSSIGRTTLSKRISSMTLSPASPTDSSTKFPLSLFSTSSRSTPQLFALALSMLIGLITLLALPFDAAEAAPADSFGDATIFESQNDLDPVGLAAVSPASEHFFIGGDGIGNGGFTMQTDTAAGVQLGLRAADRFLNDFLPNDGAGTYFATPGASPVGPSDPPGSVRASWNYYMHVDLGADLAPLVASGDVVAPGPLTGTSVVDSVLLDVDFDPSKVGTAFTTIDAYAQAIALGGATAPLLIQDTQNLAFDFWGLLGAPAFDVDAEGFYTIRLRAMSGATVIAMTEIVVVVGTPEELIVSFGTQGGMATTETIFGIPVEPRDALSVDTGAPVFNFLAAGEDIDAFHYLPNGNALFSTTTSVTVGGNTFSPGDIVEFDGTTSTLFFDDTLITSAAKNIDAFTILPNGNLLLSTSLNSTIFGFAFANGDIVEVDPVGMTAALFNGLSEAALFTGANQDIDGLHFDEATGNVLMSVRTTGGGTVGGLAYSNQSADVFELDSGSGWSASLLLDGTNLYDGSTRQLDAIYLPEPSLFAQLGAGAVFLTALQRGRTRRRRRQGE